MSAQKHGALRMFFHIDIFFEYFLWFVLYQQPVLHLFYGMRLIINSILAGDMCRVWMTVCIILFRQLCLLTDCLHSMTMNAHRSLTTTKSPEIRHILFLLLKYCLNQLETSIEWKILSLAFQNSKRNENPTTRSHFFVYSKVVGFGMFICRLTDTTE